MTDTTYCFCIHGVSIALCSESQGAADAIAELLAAYVDRGARADRAGRGGIRIALRTVGAAETVAFPAGPPLISYGPVRAQRVDGGVIVTDGHSALTVEAGGARIDGTVHPASLGLPYAFGAVLFNLALQLALRHHNLHYTHAAAVGDARRPLLLVGNSGAGKTTLAIALAAGGMPFLSDDAIFLHPGADGLKVLPFRRPLHLDDGTLRLFPALAALAVGPFQRGSRLRWDLDPYRCFPGRVIERAEQPAMLVVLKPSSDTTAALQPISAAAALQGLLPQSGLVMLGGEASRPHLDALAKSVRAGSNYALARGSSPADDPAGLAQTVHLAYERGTVIGDASGGGR